VGYLEGVYVLPEHRNCGIATQLLQCSEEWAKRKGCTEFASDCEITNENSYQFHLNAGFTEANKIICFTKAIGDKL
jgi:aminoglycoside 6'-N-acetyltransferase I